VKKTFFAVLLAASLVSGAVAADRTSVARPDVTPAGKVPVHAFVDVKGIKEAATKIFVSDALDNVVNIYNTKGKQLAQLTGFSEPQGLATDAKGNLYVANTGDSNILVYASPYTKKPKTLNDPGQYPAGVAVLVSGKTTYVAVTNIISTSDGAGSVVLYKNGKIGKPISNASLGRIYFCGFDANGDLYLDGTSSDESAFYFGEIAKLTSGGKKITLDTLGNSLAFPGGVQVNTKGKIAIGDQSGAAIYTYNPPKKGTFGNPISTTPITGSSDDVTFAFTSTDGDVWTADAGTGDSFEFKYPKGGNAVATITVGGQPIGVAVTPYQAPGK
jgi:hypothetical protein